MLHSFVLAGITLRMHMESLSVRSRDRGATAVEYGLMVGLIAVVIITAVALLGKNVKNMFNTVATSV